MSSILTNASAMTALQTLQATNKNLETTQGRIATGQRVATASDNAAYWSIATTMRSDNGAMGTVRDALGLGAAQVDVAYTAMDAVKNTLDSMKKSLVAASQPDVDKAKVQAELAQFQNDLKTYAEAANFSGGNWLSVSETSTQKIVASFTRDSAGGISLGTIDVDTSKTALFNSASGAAGILEQGFTTVADKDITDLATPAATDGTAGPPATAGSATVTGITGGTTTWAEGDTFSFDVAVDGGEAITVKMTRGEADFTAQDFTDALAAAGAEGVTAGFTGGTLTLTSGTTGTTSTVAITNLEATELEVDDSINVTNFDITDASAEEIGLYLNDIETAFAAVTTAASDLGAIKTRIDSQQSFVKNIMDAVDRGVGQLVDADMNEESTRLQALQVQQQLGIQALSIANGSAQQILSLFR